MVHFMIGLPGEIGRGDQRHPRLRREPLRAARRATRGAVRDAAPGHGAGAGPLVARRRRLGAALPDGPDAPRGGRRGRSPAVQVDLRRMDARGRGAARRDGQRDLRLQQPLHLLRDGPAHGDHDPPAQPAARPRGSAEARRARRRLRRRRADDEPGAGAAAPPCPRPRLRARQRHHERAHGLLRGLRAQARAVGPHVAHLQRARSGRRAARAGTSASPRRSSRPPAASGTA